MPSIFVFYWPIVCAFREQILFDEGFTMQKFASSDPTPHNAGLNSSPRAAIIDWPLLVYWLTYLSMVFAILCAFIADGL